MKLSGKLLVVVALFVTGISAFPQTAPAQPGIVVEEVAKNSEGERRGFQAGDLMLRWSRADKAGTLETPFDLLLIELEQVISGPITIEGQRGAEKRSWVLGPDEWGLSVRPALAGPQAQSPGQGKEQAAERLRVAAEKVSSSDPAWLKSWYLLSAGDLLSGARQWKAADEFYSRSVEAAPPDQPVILAHLLRAWAASFRRRSDLLNADKYYRQAVDASRKAGGENMICADSLNKLGLVWFARGDLDKGEGFFQQALAMRSKLAPESLAVSATLNNLGNITLARGNFAKAEEYYRHALAIAQKIAPGRRDEGYVLNGLGTLAIDRGDLEAAEDYLLKGLAIKEKLSSHDSLDVASSFNNLGIVAREKGDSAKAENYYRQALEIKEKLAPGSIDVARTLSNLGSIYWERGDFAMAEEYYHRALAIEEKQAPDSMDIAGSFLNLGIVATDRGDFDTAEDYFRRALAIQEKLAPGSLQVAHSYLSIGNARLGRRDLAGAESYYLKALDIRQRLTPDSFELAGTLSCLGLVYFEKNKLDEAEQYHKRALAIREKTVPGTLFVAESLTNLGSTVSKRGDLTKAYEYYEKALEIQHKLAPGTMHEAGVMGSIAFNLKSRGKLDAAADYYVKTLAALDSQSERLGGGDQARTVFYGHFTDYYREYADLLVAQNKVEMAYQVLQRYRARSLLDTLTAARVDIRKGADPALLDRERLLRAEINGKAERRLRLLSDEHTEEQVKAVEMQIAALTDEYQKLQEQIRSASPGYSALVQPKALSVREVQQNLLDPDTLLLEYSLSESRSLVFVLSSTSIDAYPLADEFVLYRSAGRLYDLLTERNLYVEGESDEQRQRRWNKAEAEYPKALADLSHLLLGPLAGKLKNKRLLIVADSALEFVPFSVLTEPAPANSAKTDTPLFVRHEIVNLPSASVLGILRAQAAGRKPAPRAIAVLADPVFDKGDTRVTAHRVSAQPVASVQPDPDQDQAVERSAAMLNRAGTEMGLTRDGKLHLPRLPYSRREADAIFAMAPAGAGKEALDFQASKATAMSPELAQYRIVHFATHGLVNGEHPELSGLVFSLVDQEGKRQDGFLHLQDIYNMDLPVELVVLSACETALGKEIRGEGMIGLTRGFMYAGATRVVASLWEVSDVASSQFMTEFYSSMEKDGAAPAAALRAAQLSMWKQKRWNKPYYWGAFQIHGEWK